MEKNQSNNNTHNPLKTYIVREVAKIRGVKVSAVYKVINGTRNNDDILSSYLSVKEAVTTAVMQEAVTQLVPFETSAQ